MKLYRNIFEKIVSLENLFASWNSFEHDKRKRKDVQEFGFKLEENIFSLRKDLLDQSYKHGPYTPFYIHDPKQRLIHKATVKDRVVHHAVFRALNPIFEESFIPNSFSCRVGRGTHKGVETLVKTLRKVSKNNTGVCFALKCDVKKFFGSIDHRILIKILDKKIKDKRAMRLLEEIIQSYSSTPTERESETPRRGIPIGNLTSQLFANIYMNKLDQFVKHKLKVKHYLRYTDDFVIVSENEKYLEDLIKPINGFLRRKLKLSVHPQKVILRKYGQGIDFLGYIILPRYKIVRAKTRKRIFRKTNKLAEEYEAGMITKEKLEQSLASYKGVLSHANSYELFRKLKDLVV